MEMYRANSDNHYAADKYRRRRLNVDHSSNHLFFRIDPLSTKKSADH